MERGKKRYVAYGRNSLFFKKKLCALQVLANPDSEELRKRRTRSANLREKETTTTTTTTADNKTNLLPALPLGGTTPPLPPLRPPLSSLFAAEERRRRRRKEKSPFEFFLPAPPEEKREKWRGKGRRRRLTQGVPFRPLANKKLAFGPLVYVDGARLVFLVSKVMLYFPLRVTENRRRRKVFHKHPIDHSFLRRPSACGTFIARLLGFGGSAKEKYTARPPRSPFPKLPYLSLWLTGAERTGVILGSRRILPEKEKGWRTHM